MDLSLSWNLLVLSIFIAVIAFSLIIGINQTVKSLITTYLSLLTADGLGNILQEHVLGTANVSKFLGLFDLSVNDHTVFVVKVVVFIVCFVFITIKGSFYVTIQSERFPKLNPVVTTVFGFLNAALIQTSGFMFAAGASLIRANFVETNIAEVYSNSSYVRLLVDFHNLWFTLPVVLFIVWGMFDKIADENI